jgi:16S rRNA processing protein RimM
MIRLEEIAPIGIFGKTHGIKGEINLELNIDFDLENTPYIIVDIDGIFVPFFIEDYRYKSDTMALVLFEDINTEEQVRPFFGKKAYVKKDALGEDENDEMSINYYVGFTMLTPQRVVIGQIVEIDDSTANVLFVLDNDALVPVGAVEVLDLDTDNHTMIVEIPEGLLDIDN